MRLFGRSRQEEERLPAQTPPRHHLADLLSKALIDERIQRVTIQRDNEGPLGGISDTIRIIWIEDGHETRCSIAVYGDSDIERMERMGV